MKGRWFRVAKIQPTLADQPTNSLLPTYLREDLPTLLYLPDYCSESTSHSIYLPLCPLIHHRKDVGLCWPTVLEKRTEN